MTTEFPNDTVLRRYLLGTLPENQWDEIEQRLLQEDNFAGNVEVIEDEIIDDYLQGTLSKEERRAVETHFLCPPERQRKLWFARLLRSHLQPQPIIKPVPTPWFQRPAFSWAMSLATVTLLVATVGLGVYTANLKETLKSENAKRQDTEAKLREALNRTSNLTSPLFPQLPAYEDRVIAYMSPNQPVALSLMELERGQQRIPELNQTLEIHIALVHGVQSSYKATLQNASGSKIWSKAELKPTGYQLIFTIPRTILLPGTYSLTVLGQGDTHQSTYPFVVR